jgi:outer membrane autotransporter protein
MTFKDGTTAIGTGTLAAGVATFTTASLANGAHSITASYSGLAGFAASTSSTLTQTVAIPADSIKLRQMQVAVTKVVAQNSGQAIAGAIDDAIENGFSDGGELITPSGNGMRFNFAADTDQSSRTNRDNMVSERETDMFAKDDTNPLGQSGSGTAHNPRNRSRIDDAFTAMASSTMPTKARPVTTPAPKDWLLWADVRGSGIDRWNSSPGTAQAQLYGWQVNTLVGLTRRLTPSFLIGVLGGYETFNYTSQDLNGKLKGDGWTVGSYLGWKLTSSIRFDLAVAYSGIGYDGTAGSAQGNFGGHRWLVASGFTGDYKIYGFTVEPSAKVYALWEHEDAYTDSLGTRQDERDFSTGRASGGVKLIYPFEWSESVALAPYVGLYGDYYFTYDNAADVVSADATPFASTPLLDGWSARLAGGLTAKLAGGSSIGLGAELGGIGSDVEIWTFRARGTVPF